MNMLRGESESRFVDADMYLKYQRNDGGWIFTSISLRVENTSAVKTGWLTFKMIVKSTCHYTPSGQVLRVIPPMKRT